MPRDSYQRRSGRKLKEQITRRVGQFEFINFKWIARHFNNEGEEVWAGSHLDPEHDGPVLIEWHDFDDIRLVFYKVKMAA